MAGTMLGAAAPAGAAQIGIEESDNGPVEPGGPTRSVYVIAAPGERNDITIRASDLTPRVKLDDAPGAGASPVTVTITDPGATFEGTLAGDAPCEIVDAHTAVCRADPGAYFTRVVVSSGDGDDRLQFARDSVPLRERFLAGDGNDEFTTGVFDGDNAGYRFSSDMGPGDDTVRIGASTGTRGLGLYAGDGDDTVFAANGAADSVDCGLGQDTLLADPFDGEELSSSPNQPCETRLVPHVATPLD